MHRFRSWGLDVSEGRTNRNRGLSAEGISPPSLALDFTSGVLDPRIDFQSTSPASYISRPFNQNLLTQSQNIVTGLTPNIWSAVGSTLTGSSGASPEGTNNASLLKEDSTNGRHDIFGDSTLGGAFAFGALTATYSVYIKASGRTWVKLSLGGSGVFVGAYFDLTNVSVGTIDSGFTAQISDVGNGWRRCAITTTAAAGTVFPRIRLASADGTDSYQGDGASGVLVWGAQLTEGSLLTPYIPTTTAAITEGQLEYSKPWNMVLHSQGFDSLTSWVNTIAGTGVNPTRNANNAVAPDGTTTADTITFNSGSTTGSGNYSLLTQTITTAILNSIHTGCIWLRGTVGGEQIVIRLNGNDAYILATLTTAWQKFTVSTNYTSGSLAFQFGIRPRIDLAPVMNTTATVEVWGAQLNEGTEALPYRSTTTAVLYQPRFQVNPETRRPEGLLLEITSQNLLLRSAEVRTSPWSVTSLTTQGPSITAPDGTVSGVEVVGANGVAGGNAYTLQIVTASPTTNYAYSVFLKPKGTARNTRLNIVSKLSGVDTGSSFIGEFNHTTLTASLIQSGAYTNTTVTSYPVGNGWYRVILTGTTQANIDGLRVAVYSHQAGDGVNGVYVWGAQLEPSRIYARSYIPTTTTAVSYATDIAQINDPWFSALVNQQQGTLYTEQTVTTLTGGASCAAEFFKNGTSFMSIGIGVGGSTANIARWWIRNDNINQVVLTRTITPAPQIGSIVRCIGTYSNSGCFFTMDGATNISSDTDTNILPTPTTILRFTNGVNTRAVRRVAYWPTQLPNDLLPKLTTASGGLFPEASQALFNPLVSVDFTTGSLDPMFTFTRASSATIINSSGLVETVGNDIPQFDYDPTTNECIGLNIETQSTNLIGYSQELYNWLDYDVDYSTTTTSPSGGSAQIIKNTNTGGEGVLEYDDFFPTSIARVFSFWAKRITGTGVFKVSVAPSGASFTTIPVTSTWQRYSVTYTGTAQPSFALEEFNDSVAVWGVQLEERSTMTSYIPTLGASAVTRVASTCIATGDQVSSWFNLNQSTFVVRGKKRDAARKPLIALGSSITSAPTDESIELGIGFGSRLSINSLSRDNYTQSSLSIGAAATNELGIAFSLIENGASSNIVIDSLTTGIITPSFTPFVNTLLIGSNYSGSINANRYDGHIKSFEYYEENLTTSQLQSLLGV